MTAQRAAHDQHITDRQPLCAPVNVRGDCAQPCSINKQFIRRAALHDFGITGDNSDTRFACGARHALDDGV
ncbi:hypothetical protein D3C78_1461090 [compost metagenome]